MQQTRDAADLVFAALKANLPGIYDHPDGALMTSVGPFRYVRAESLARGENAQSHTTPQSPQSISDCDCPMHATRNNKPS